MRLAILAALLAAAPALAEPLDLPGTLNPDELSLDSVIERASRGEVDMMTCAQGYLVTKQGDHVDARAIFEACAAAGWTGAMTWMSQLDANGLGAPEDPAAAADWSRRAAAMGDAVAQFNHGLDLLRGYGVARDVQAGRRLVDQAAEAGLGDARRLQAADYDPSAVTPDSDEWKYMRWF